MGRVKNMAAVMVPVGLLFSACSWGSAEVEAETVNYSIGNVDLIVPSEYLAAFAPPVTSGTEVALLTAELPSMAAFPRSKEDDSPVAIRYADRVQISIQAPGPVGAEETYARTIKRELGQRALVGEEFGLKKYRLNKYAIGASPPANVGLSEGDLMATFSYQDGYLICTPVPAVSAGSRPSTTRPGELLPLCVHGFHAENGALRVELTYRRHHLSHWAQIKSRAEALIHGFLQEEADGLKGQVHLSAP